MSDINPVGHTAAATLGTTRPAAAPAATTDSPSRQRDQVELSTTARLLSKIGVLSGVRQDVVDRVRSELEAGTYETPEKLDAAVDALLSEEELS